MTLGELQAISEAIANNAEKKLTSSRLYYCPNCTAMWYGNNLRQSGTIPFHRAPYWDSPVCAGSDQIPVTKGNI